MHASEINLGRLTRTLAGGEICVVAMESCDPCPKTGGKLSDKRVVVLQSVVVALALHGNAVLCARKLILQTQEVLIRAQLGIVLNHHQQAAESAVQLLVRGDFALRSVGGKQLRAGPGDIAKESLLLNGKAFPR